MQDDNALLELFRHAWRGYDVPSDKKTLYRHDTVGIYSLGPGEHALQAAEELVGYLREKGITTAQICFSSMAANHYDVIARDENNETSKEGDTWRRVDLICVASAAEEILVSEAYTHHKTIFATSMNLGHYESLPYIIHPCDVADFSIIAERMQLMQHGISVTMPHKKLSLEQTLEQIEAYKEAQAQLEKERQETQVAITG